MGALDKEEEEEERTSCTNTLEPPEEEEEETGSGASTFTVRTSFRQYIFLFYIPLNKYNMRTTNGKMPLEKFIPLPDDTVRHLVRGWRMVEKRKC